MNAITATHEQFIHGVRDIVVTWAQSRQTITADEAVRLSHSKLVYGVGNGARGTCYFEAWENGVGKVAVIEVAALAEESWVQLASTTIHELAHVLAGHGAGHEKAWKDATLALGFIKRLNVGQSYHLSQIHPQIRQQVYELAARIGDGSPAFALAGLGALLGKFVRAPRSCSAGVGARGGTSRGKGSGSRLRLWECRCPKPVKVRVASDDFQAHCDRCGSAFERK